MLILVELRLRIDHAQVSHRLEILWLGLFDELELSFEHLLNVKVVEQDLSLWHLLSQCLVKFKMTLND